MLRRNIAAPSLKILWKNLNSVKFYDKSNMNVFTLSQRENFRWGLIYFDQFTIIDFNEVDIRIYLPEKVIIHRGRYNINIVKTVTLQSFWIICKSE